MRQQLKKKALFYAQFWLIPLAKVSPLLSQMVYIDCVDTYGAQKI